MHNGSIEIKGRSNVVREQTIEINLSDLPVETDINRVKIIVTAYSDNGRPRSRTLVKRRSGRGHENLEFGIRN